MSEVAESARALLLSLLRDIELSKTREEHIRMTARANAMESLVLRLEELRHEVSAA